MSNLFDIDPLNFEEQDDIDALNDETFGCDLADINDDWEGEHDKLTGFGDPPVDAHFRGKTEELQHTQQLQQSASHVSDIESFLNFTHSGKSLSSNQLNDDAHPFYEDIVKKSISNFILDDDLYDEDDICPDFNSYELEGQNEQAISKSTATKVDKKSINLESLRPPSPSILPFDDTFMSSVWRPLSPELDFQKHRQQHLNDSSIIDTQTNFSKHTPKDSKVLTLEELEKNMTHTNGHNDTMLRNDNIEQASKPKAIRLEDLEAQLLDSNKHTNQMTPSSTSNHLCVKAGTTSSTTPSSVPQTQPSFPAKLPPNIMEIAAMSLSKLALQPQQPTIPTANKIVPPPPGLGSKYNLSGGSASVEANKLPSVTQQQQQQISAGYFAKMSPNQKASAESQLAMANAMANALANFSQLPTVRPPIPGMAGDMKLPHPSVPMVLDPIAQQEQQRLISRIITPAQAQRFYPSHFNNFSGGRNQDKFAGFMTQKEKDWLVKIFRLQCKVNDPYVEDYYEVNFKVKKATTERRQNLAKQHNKNADDEAIDAMIESDPLIVLPELAKVEEEKPKYIQFDKALGKIQVLNTKCPRKLLDVNPDKPSPLNTDYSYNSFLIKIERLYEHLLNIEDSDKRMPILPEHIIPLRLEIRVQLCQLLFNGLVKPVNISHKDEGTFFILVNRNMPTLKKLDTEVDPDILKINKGALLVYRSLLLREESQLVVLLSSLVKSSIYKKFILEVEQNTQINYGNMLIKALGRIEQTRNLIYIAASIDDVDAITQNKFGHRFLVTIFKQYKASNDKLLFIYFWKLFVQALMERVAVYPELRQICMEHFHYLTEL